MKLASSVGGQWSLFRRGARRRAEVAKVSTCDRQFFFVKLNPDSLRRTSSYRDTQVTVGRNVTTVAGHGCQQGRRSEERRSVYVFTGLLQPPYRDL
jgi:hypothetical protein